MRIVLQRVTKAKVTVNDEIIGRIGKGYVIFLGIGREDTEQLVEKYVDKIMKLRIFEDKEGKINLSLKDVAGDVLVISQFTLYADCKKGNRPNFIQAGSPEKAEELYEHFLQLCREKIGSVQSGSFGADMKVSLTNDGPFTIVLDDNNDKN